MDSSLTIALKEWAVVQRALLEGRQIFLLRKGGLIEESSQFDLRARSFLIQPTYIHSSEREGDVSQEFHDWLCDEESKRGSDGMIRFESYCDATECIEIKSPGTLANLAGQHIWSDEYLSMRINWEPYKPLYAVIVRTYKLAAPVTAQAHPEYFGCKSWIDLREAVSIDDAAPAIEDNGEFEQKIADFMAAIK